jgi:hypothetical protein
MTLTAAGTGPSIRRCKQGEFERRLAMATEYLPDVRRNLSVDQNAAANPAFRGFRWQFLRVLQRLRAGANCDSRLNLALSQNCPQPK